MSTRGRWGGAGEASMNLHPCARSVAPEGQNESATVTLPWPCGSGAVRFRTALRTSPAAAVAGASAAVADIAHDTSLEFLILNLLELEKSVGRQCGTSHALAGSHAAGTSHVMYLLHFPLDMLPDPTVKIVTLPATIPKFKKARFPLA